MKSAPFQMHQPNSVEQVLHLLEQYGEDARILAGGQTLVPVLAMRVATPENLIDINQINSLKQIEYKHPHLEIFAGVRQSSWNIGMD